MQIRNLRLQAKVKRQRENAGTGQDEKRKATQLLKQKIQLEEIKQEVPEKEGRLIYISKQNKTMETK